MKNGKKFIIICVILTGIGFLLTGIGSILGGRVTGIGLNQNGFLIYTPHGPYTDGSDFKEYEEKELSLEAFTSLTLNADYGDVTVMASDHYGIAYGMPDYETLTYDIQDGALNVTEYDSRSMDSNGNIYLFNLNFGSFTDGSDYETPYLTIYVPENADLDKITVKNESGYIRLSDLQSNLLTVTCDYGDMKVNNISSNDININMESGYLEMDTVTSDTLSAYNDYGDIDMQQLSVSGDARIALESGNCNLKELSVDNLDISSSYGSVDLYLNTPLSEYGYDLYTDYGSISLNEEDKNMQYLLEKESSKLIKIRCESGDISIYGMD